MPENMCRLLLLYWFLLPPSVAWFYKFFIDTAACWQMFLIGHLFVWVHAHIHISFELYSSVILIVAVVFFFVEFSRQHVCATGCYSNCFFFPSQGDFAFAFNVIFIYFFNCFSLFLLVFAQFLFLFFFNLTFRFTYTTRLICPTVVCSIFIVINCKKFFWCL